MDEKKINYHTKLWEKSYFFPANFQKLQNVHLWVGHGCEKTQN